MQLSQTQVDWILDCYEKVHAMLVKCTEERNSTILPQLGLEAMQTPMVSAFNLYPFLPSLPPRGYYAHTGYCTAFSTSIVCDPHSLQLASSWVL